MKKTLMAAASLTALISGPAFAADLPVRKESVVAPPPAMWTGFYAGLNAGYGFGTNSQAYSSSYGVFDPWQALLINSTTTTNYSSNFIGLGSALSGNSSVNQNGFLGGAQVGYNQQFMGRYVLGVEADIQGSNIRGNGQSYGLGSTSATYLVNGAGVLQRRDSNGVGMVDANAGVNWIGTVRGRAGYLITPTIMTYATAGLAYGDAWAKIQSQSLYLLSDTSGRVSGNQQFSGNGSSNQILVGYAAGGGLEWMMSPNWSLKAEGLYYNLGNMSAKSSSFSPAMYSTNDVSTILYTNSSGTVGNTNINYQGIMVKTGVNYHIKSDDIPSLLHAHHSLAPVQIDDTNNQFTEDKIIAWNGVYAGLNSGYGFGTSSPATSVSYNALDQWTGLAPSGLFGRSSILSGETINGLTSALSGKAGASQSGFVGGAQIGYNNVVYKRATIGFEADIQGTNMSSNSGSYGIGQSTIYDRLSGRAYDSNFYANSFGGNSVRAGVDWLGTVRGKIGLLISPSWMIYGTGGLSYGGVYAKVAKTASVTYLDQNVTNSSQLIYNGSQLVVGNGSKSEILLGYNVGAGIEFMLSQNWSLKSEALYYNLGNMNVQTSSFAPPVIATNSTFNYGVWYPQRMQYGTTTVNFQGIIARAGLNYHFNMSSDPVVAKF